MSLAAASESRKARLLALRKRKAGETVDADASEQIQDADPVIKSRNYDPESRTIKKHSRNDDVEMQDTVEKAVEGLAHKIITEDEERRAQELDVFNIAPKRANWDLKREMDKKLAKLERKTQESIHILIRQRLASQKDGADDIIGAMNAQEKALNQAEPLSDEED